MKKKIIPVLIAVILILCIVAGAGGIYLYQRYSYSKEEADRNAYFGLQTENEAAIVLNDTVLEEKCIVQDGHCYLTLEQVHSLLNDRFYVDYNEKLLLYTLPEETVSIGLGETGADGYVTAFEKDGKAYLALDYVKKFSDFNFAFYQQPNRVVIQTVWDAVTTAEMKKNTAVRVRGGVKSEVLVPLNKGDRIIILEEMEDWNKVQTYDGYIGYVEKKHLLESKTETPDKDTGYTEPEYTGCMRDYKINLAWHQVTTEAANATFPGAVSGVAGVNVISPTWFFLYDNTGSVESIASKEYVDAAHAKGLEVWALVDDFTHRADNGVDTKEILSYTGKRKQVIDALMAEAERCSIDGINVDFEKVASDAGEDFIQFIRELSVACHARNMVLSVDNYVPINSNAHYEWAEQGVFADYVIIMGYDEHWAGCEEAGSVASIGYVESGIKKMAEVVPPKKVMNGVPLYTRIWTTSKDNKVTSQAVGIQKAADFLAGKGVVPEWDDSVGQNFAEFETPEGLCQVWLEDEQSIAAKVSVMKHYGLGGIATWKLGFDEGRKGIWSVIAGFLTE